MVDGWRMLAADVIGKAVEEYRGTYTNAVRDNKNTRKCAHCRRQFRPHRPAERIMYCSKECWEMARASIEDFLSREWFEELAELAGVHPDVVRKNLVKPVMPESWKRVEVEVELW